MGNNCGCGHCDETHPPAGGEKTPEEKIKDLKKALVEAGFETKETPEGDIKILEKT